MGQVQSFGIFTKGSGLRPSGFTRQATSARLADDVIQGWINSSPSNRCISHFKAQLAQLFFIQHLKCTYWIKGILCGYAIRSGRHPSGSQRRGPTWGRPPSGCLPDRIAWPQSIAIVSLGFWRKPTSTSAERRMKWYLVKIECYRRNELG